jgi:dienelactone hydrolase
VWIFCISFPPLFVPKEDREAFRKAANPSPGRRGRLGAGLFAPSFTEKCSGFDSPSVLCPPIRNPPQILPAGKFMRSFKAIFALAVCAAVSAPPALAQARLGAQGAEAEPNREQQWLVPSSDPDIAAHAVLFRPAGNGPFRLAVIAHATTQNVLHRAQMPQPEYRALAAWLVARGFAVLVPERLGHGATGGRYIEDQGGCDEADYSRSGRATASQIMAALSYLRGQSFIRQDGAVVLGHSAGAWGALALAPENPQGVSAIVAFAPGRGGHANDFPNKVCAPHTLVAAAAEFGRGARLPVTWLVAANDSYFPPALSRQLADAFRGGGDKVEFRMLPAYGSEGHWLAETEGGIRIAAPELDRALKGLASRPDKKR